MNSTKPVATSNQTFEQYCEALGVDPKSTRQASLVKALHAYIGAGNDPCDTRIALQRRRGR